MEEKKMQKQNKTKQIKTKTKKMCNNTITHSSDRYFKTLSNFIFKVPFFSSKSTSPPPPNKNSWEKKTRNKLIISAQILSKFC